ncbi:hypothetical protein [Micromonospora sp. LOL_021]|uniref:hypothetical protein n=1 Tax=Micromonospora sp. LOL_021 TaxID=3345417 RepID=UPI003A8736C8
MRLVDRFAAIAGSWQIVPAGVAATPLRSVLTGGWTSVGRHASVGVSALAWYRVYDVDRHVLALKPLSE